jgi:ribosome-binding protein aMBF1 (putative translation factor)
MNARINFQTIQDANGKPTFVVMPYDEFMRTYARANDLVPHEVVNLAFDQAWTAARAWREHLGITQASLAKKLGVSQSAVAQLELKRGKMRKSTREGLATALGISAAQLDW